MTITENKNKLKSKAKNKILALGFIMFLVLVGLFGLTGKVNAQAATGACVDAIGEVTSSTQPCSPGSSWVPGTATTATTPTGTCTINNSSGDNMVADTVKSGITKTACDGLGGSWTSSSTPTNGTVFENQVTGEACASLIRGTVSGCAKNFFYYVVYMPATFILLIAAKFFNALISIALSTELFSKSTFIPTAWAIVRDLSNIFFLLILLYVAIELILDMGHDAQKIIVRVIIIALLINFSMFFTQVVIDSSNILALVFYNKLNVSIKNPDGSVRPDIPSTAEERDISGGMYNAFDPTAKLDQKFFDQARGVGTMVNGKQIPVSDWPPVGIVVGIILISVAVMLFAAYAFFISGIAFVARMIELWVLIIFSPFAFMSSAVPQLAGAEYLGWDAWLKRLLKVAFMAPIFMFFMYLIFLLIHGNLFGNMITTQGMIQTILLVVIPAMIILVLLMKATEYAKKGSGVIGEKLIAGAKMVGGLALGAATGGVAMLGSNTAGRIARNFANDDELKKKAAAGDKGAQRKLALANSLAKSSFDVRQTGLGKYAAKKTGLDFNSGLGVVGMSTDKLKGGRAERDKEGIAKHEEKVKSYELSKSGAEKQNTRREKYTQDKNQVQENHNTVWEKQYEADKTKAKNAPRGSNEKPFDEKKFRADYEAGKNVSVGGRTVLPPPKFDEKKFKEAYEKGGDMNSYGLNKEVEAGSVGTAEQVNKERRQAYAWSLENPDKKRTEDGQIIKKDLADYKSSFKAGVANMTVTPAGLTTTAVAGALTGGVGLVVAPIIGGLAQIIKDMAKDTLAANKVTGYIFGERKDTVAAVRKEKSANEKFIDALKTMNPTKPKDAEELIKLKDKVVEPTSPPTGNPQGNQGTPPPGHN